MSKAATEDRPINLAQTLAKKAAFRHFTVWLVGDTPLITHAWSEKAKREMLSKQVKAPKAGKEARDPHADFVSSLYEMGKDKNGNDAYGFPVTGIKNCILSAAHKDKGIARSATMASLWLEAEMVRVRPALAGAICDMPLVRIHGSKPEMREDMVRVGSGLNKTASLAYRAQFTTWAIKIRGRFNATALNEDQIAFLISEAGPSFGLGEWRNERKGMFGAFHIGSPEEEAAWERFIAGKGPLPVPAPSAMVA